MRRETDAPRHRAFGIIGFVAIACPTCNKMLMLLFGGELLMAYMGPIRPHLATLGVLILFAVVLLGVQLAAGLLFPFAGWLLSPVFAALAMSLNSVSVVGNALRLRRLRRRWPRRLRRK